jgi:hypothetical protein
MVVPGTAGVVRLDRGGSGVGCAHRDLQPTRCRAVMCFSGHATLVVADTLLSARAVRATGQGAEAAGVAGAPGRLAIFDERFA